MSDWQPIETAPKDGTLCLMWNPSVGIRTAYIPKSMAHYKKIKAVIAGNGRSIGSVNASFQPLKWQPAPFPPTTDQTAREFSHNITWSEPAMENGQ